MTSEAFAKDHRRRRSSHTNRAVVDRDHRDERWRGYLERIAAGDQAAMDALFAESWRISAWMSRRILNRPEDAEEVLADAYIQVWRNAANYDAAKGGVSNWIVLMVRSRALDLARRRTSRSRWEVHLPAQCGEHACLPSPEQEQLSHSQARRVRAALAELPTEERILLELAYDEELSHTQIVGRTGLPLGTVKTRIRRGLMRLRRSLGHQAGLDPAKYQAA